MPFFDHFATSRGTRLGDLLTKKTAAAEFGYLQTRFQLRPETEILEIGAGHGELAKVFLEAGYRKYDVIEPNRIMREELIAMGARRAWDYIVPPLHAENASYDLILIQDVLEHLNGASEAQTFISEAARTLRPGGSILISSPDYADWGIDFFNCDFSHSYPTTVRRIDQMFQNSNLETLSYRYSYSCFHGLAGWMLNRLVKLATWRMSGEQREFKPYKLRLTFLRRLTILGGKPLR